MRQGMRRVMIVGQPGSGKSTLARALAARLGVPVVHMDHIHWQPGWVERDAAEKTTLVRAAIAGAAWVFEGGHSETYSERLARADTLIWLDMVVAGRLWRCTLRAWRYRGRVRPDMQVGCPEDLGAQYRDFMRWIWRTRTESRANLAQLYGSAPEGKTRVRLQRFSQVDRWLEVAG